MSNPDMLLLDQSRLVEAWNETLPTTMNETDRCEVHADEEDPRSLRVTIFGAGHQMYSYDFKVTYVDSREVKVTLIDVDQDKQTIDERKELVQEQVADYIRHLHECAQALHRLTKV
ncbi:hypothetical protein ACLBWT_21330 [Paenibacillus sp. D51F]|uniref:hypothetical protein n=1 Tax=unclassified Paenibacillus TaxID=185978 RepID=UPI000953F3E8|nr:MULTISPECIES: hypothetical protein [unclassified Paenibacillus]ASS67740.1 hypothetical protein CIC07_17500 [Paenibacillus sp. RUD330]SIR61795.1 hypothetical protein SAMN05880555_4475 [Paenibacillus sp. RU4X]SIR70400.1 hypothetical protein SAMN05880570_4477 [Paenibacillus sp. RU4T]